MIRILRCVLVYRRLGLAEEMFSSPGRALELGHALNRHKMAARIMAAGRGAPIAPRKETEQ